MASPPPASIPLTQEERKEAVVTARPEAAKVESPAVGWDVLLTAAEQALAQGDAVSARGKLSEALSQAPNGPQRSRIIGHLDRIGQETILSPRIFENDPLVERYVIQPGDSLVKIAAANRVTADLLADINRIADKHMVRAGQMVKIVKGPFDAVVEKDTYKLHVYLGNTFVREFSVGLGADDSTPEGKWRVSSKLMNPTYYPPRGGRILAADDPQNPLGERWIGLTGIEGAAVGQERYGIHGTIEPDSIGRDSSMGCIRLRNEDVEKLFTYLVDKHSTVTVK